MALECRKCKYFNEYYIFDEETGDEFPLFFCEKGHNDELDSDCKCQYFKKYHDRKYVEKDTECDICENAKICEKLCGVAFDCTTMNDSKSHVVYKKDYCTKIDGTNADEILRRRSNGLTDEEIVKLIEKEKLQKIIEIAEKTGIEIQDYVTNMCKKLWIEV